MADVLEMLPPPTNLMELLVKCQTLEDLPEAGYLYTRAIGQSIHENVLEDTEKTSPTWWHAKFANMPFNDFASIVTLFILKEPDFHLDDAELDEATVKAKAVEWATGILVYQAMFLGMLLETSGKIRVHMDALLDETIGIPDLQKEAMDRLRVIKAMLASPRWIASERMKELKHIVKCVRSAYLVSRRTIGAFVDMLNGTRDMLIDVESRVSSEKLLAGLRAFLVVCASRSESADTGSSIRDVAADNPAFQLIYTGIGKNPEDVAAVEEALLLLFRSNGDGKKGSDLANTLRQVLESEDMIAIMEERIQIDKGFYYQIARQTLRAEQAARSAAMADAMSGEEKA